MSRSQMKYHPRIGYTYMPSAKLRVAGVGGGYLVRTNAAGFRSDREFVRERTLTRPTFNPPGSVFKPFVASFALDKLGFDTNQRFRCVPLKAGDRFDLPA